MIYVGALLLMILTTLLLEGLSIKEKDEKSTQVCKLIAIFLLLILQVWIVGHGLTHIIGR